MLKRLLFASSFAMLALASSAQGTVISSENFNASTDLPTGWSQTTLATDGGWVVGNPADLSSSSFPIDDLDGNAIITNDDGCNCDKSADVLVFAPIDLSGQTQAYLLFDLYYFDAAYQGDQESLDMKASTDGGTTWTLVKSFDGLGAWRKEAIDLSAFVGASNLLVSLTYGDAAGWLYGAALDNVSVVIPDNVLRVSLAAADAGRYVDAIPAVVGGYDKFWVGGNFILEGTFSNDGFVPVTSFDVSWTKGAQTASTSFSGLNIPFTGRYDFMLDLPAFVAGTNDDDYTIAITNINGGDDNDVTDNSGVVNVNVEGVEPAAGRKVVVEEATGTWCQWCPRGAVLMDFIAENYPTTAVPVAVHNGDPMTVATYDTGLGTLIGGYPSGLVDRAYVDIDPLEFEAALIDRLSTPAPVSVQHNVSYDAATRLITVESHLHFLEELNGNFKIAMVITEDDVTGTSSTWRQTNAYSGGGNGAMGGFEALPTQVPAAQMVYNHVGRTIFNSFTGAAGSVPALNPAGSDVVFTSTYTHPTTQDVTQMHAVTMLINAGTGEIVNAEQTAIPFMITASNEPVKSDVAVEVYPNPVSDLANVSFRLAEQKDVQIRLADVTGKVVYEANMGKMNGVNKLPIRVQHLNAGSYMLTVNIGGEITTKPIVVVR